MTKIFIDPGHGGRDPGAVANGLQEKDIVLTIAQQMRYMLEDYADVEVTMSREDDRFVRLSERAQMANEWGADYFVSVHVNAGGGTGFESFIWNGNVFQATIANQNVVHAEIVRHIGGTDRGKKRANFAVLRETSMPSILTENMFIDRPSDASKLKDQSFLQRIARGHVNGLVQVFGLSGGSQGGGSSWIGQILRNGDRGGLVKSLQEQLIDNGFALSRYGADGMFGSETENALRSMQSATGIAVDGIAGPQSYQALQSYSGGFRFRHWAGSVIRNGARGNNVRELQERLLDLGYSLPRFGADGAFGDETANAVRQFQRDAGIGVDGIPGPETYRALLAT